MILGGVEETSGEREAAHSHYLAGSEIVNELLLLGNEGDLLGEGLVAERGDQRTPDKDVAGEGLEHLGDGFEQGGFTAPVGAEESSDGACCESQVKVREHRS